MKIHILGGSGSGKTYISNILSEKLNLLHFDLDDIQWNNSFKIKRTDIQRNKMLHDILESNESYIIEGCYHIWPYESFEKADYIFYLYPPLLVRINRILKRYFKRKINNEPKQENFKRICKLILSYLKEDKKQHKETLAILNKYGKKVYCLKNSKEILEVLNII